LEENENNHAMLVSRYQVRFLAAARKDKEGLSSVFVRIVKMLTLWMTAVCKDGEVQSSLFSKFIPAINAQNPWDFHNLKPHFWSFSSIALINYN
jgi:hypothetical protein